MACPERPVLLSKYVHGHGKKTYDELHASNCVKDGFDTAVDEPVIRMERQGKTKNVLENELAREGFDGDVACENNS
jgi:hypothetical protein